MPSLVQRNCHDNDLPIPLKGKFVDVSVLFALPRYLGECLPGARPARYF